MRVLLLSLFLFLTHEVFAVNIQNWDQHACEGSMRQCTGIDQNTCCRSRTRPYSSSKFRGVVEFEIGVVHTKRGEVFCGHASNAKAGPSPCIERPGLLGLRGSSWYSCVNRCDRLERDESPINALEEYTGGEQCERAVEEDKILIDGHMFEINYDVPQNVTDMLNDLADSNARYASFPAEILDWEVEESVVAEFLAD